MNKNRDSNNKVKSSMHLIKRVLVIYDCMYRLGHIFNMCMCEVVFIILYIIFVICCRNSTFVHIVQYGRLLHETFFFQWQCMLHAYKFYSNFVINSTNIIPYALPYILICLGDELHKWKLQKQYSGGSVGAPLCSPIKHPSS